MKYLILTTLTIFTLISCKPEWEASKVKAKTSQNVTLSQAKKMITENADLVLIDVRTPQEISQGKIKNAIELNFNDDIFENSLDRLDKEKTYLIYCKSGGRSSKATNKMRKKGFNKTFNMEGGYTAWIK